MSSSSIKLAEVPKIANARRSIRHVFIRDLVMVCSIGIHQHEKNDEQRVRINLDLAVDESDQEVNDDINNVISINLSVINLNY